jgi:geranylgeranyl diphosphate synthase type I
MSMTIADLKFNQILSKYQQEINFELERFFNQKIRENSLFFKRAAETIKILKDINLGGGKRLRPILVNLGYSLAGGKNKKAILEASLAVELIHNYFLIHDDIIDEDDLRRGRPSLYAFYQKKFNDLHLGISLAMVAGDISCALGYQALNNSPFPDRDKIRAVDILNKMIVKTCHGEMLELFFKKRRVKLTEEDILNVSKYKTAYYTFVYPLKIGAALAGQRERFLAKLEEFALPLGIAFQIQDDILGLFGSEKEFGKPIGSDIEENQPNLLIFKTLILIDPEDRQKIKSYLGRKKPTQKDIRRIREIVKKSGSLDYCQEKAQNLVNKAKSIIKRMRIPLKEKKFLLELANYIIERNY